MAIGKAPTVVITGASAGVGRATAIAFARQGCRVGLIARGPEGLEGTCQDVERAGGAALALQADVADYQAVATAADRCVQTWGEIDIWVNCAMATVFSPFKEISVPEFHRVTEVTYLGQVHGAMAALKHMRSRNRGTIVFVGSALSYRAIPLQSAYCGAKFALRGFVDALRCELIHDNCAVRLTMVQLPALNTPQFDWARNRLPNRPQPVPPIFQPETAAASIVRAARAAPRELWVGGSTLKAILGNMALPRWLDRELARRCYAGQQTSEPDAVDRPDNLFAPLAGDHGVHGRFDDRASPKALAVDAASARIALAGLTGASVVLLLAALRRRG